MVASRKTQVSQLDGIGQAHADHHGGFTIGALSMIGVPPTRLRFQVVYPERRDFV